MTTGGTRVRRLGVAAVLAAGLASHADAQLAAEGPTPVVIAGVKLIMYTARPAGCEPRSVLLVFHGVERDAGPYRDRARPLADHVCAFVVAPEFDRARFPRDLYQYGGAAQPASAAPGGVRPIDLAAPLIAWARSAAGRDLPVVLLGHSAGAQYVDRVAAYAPVAGVRYVVANPSTWVLPNGAAAPLGLDGSDPAIRAYLAQPITLLLGGADTGQRNLAMSPEAMAQGPNRIERGRATFAMAQDVARRHGWTLGWRLLEVPGVGHDAAAMFASPQAAEAAGP